MKRLLLVVALLSLVLTTAPALAFPQIEVHPAVPVLSYDQAVTFFRRLDQEWRAIPAQDKVPVIRTQADAERWVNELAPYFIQEGVVSAPGEEDAIPDIVIPTGVTFKWYPDDPDWALHVLANTGLCGTGIEFNARVLTPGDPWMDNNLAIVVLAHEMAHVQGVCGGDTPINDESSAQIISWEVTAAISNAGCQPCLAGLLGELRHRALGAVEQAAITEHRLPEFLDIVNSLDPVERAQEVRSFTVWANQPDELRDLLTQYYSVPIAAIAIADARHDPVLSGMMMPGTFMYEPAGLYRSFSVDDLLYVLDQRFR